MLLVADVVKDKRRQMTGEERSLFGIDKLNVPRSEIPVVTHVDYSARVQKAHQETNPRYYAVIKTIQRNYGAVIMNKSFKVRGEPIICDPEDAFKCFMGTELDVLVVENSILEKIMQSQASIPIKSICVRITSNCLMKSVYDIGRMPEFLLNTRFKVKV
jgi:carbamoyltransferase